MEMHQSYKYYRRNGSVNIREETSIKDHQFNFFSFYIGIHKGIK